MALKHLRTEEMLQVSGTWLNPQSPARAAILSIPDLAAKLPRAEEAHSNLAAAAQPAKNPRLDEITTETGKLDLRHDSIIRGVYHHLTATAELLGDAVAVDLIDLRDTLIPDGLPSMQKTYRAEAGQAQQLEDRLSPSLKSRTDSILIGQGPAQKPLTKYLVEWIEIGKKLGALEDERARLLAEQADASSGTILVKARNRWIRVVNAMLADGDLADLPAQTDALVFGPLRDAEKTAELRSRPAPANKETTSDAVETPAGS